MRISFGHRLTLSPTGSANDNEIFRFQNYRINQEHDGFLFLPFGFSGLCANRSPDNIEASLVFPNSGLSRTWATRLLDEQWFAQVTTLFDENINADLQPGQTLFTYQGICMSAAWDEERLSIRLGTILDSVRGSVPNRVLSRSLVGNLPISSGVRMS
jgi:hypothetical protein